MTRDELFKEAFKAGLGKLDKILLDVPVMYRGWEMDNQGWIVLMNNGSLKALTTDHGELCEWTMEQISKALADTIESAQALAEALRLLAPSPPSPAA